MILTSLFALARLDNLAVLAALGVLAYLDNLAALKRSRFKDEAHSGTTRYALERSKAL